MVMIEQKLVFFFLPDKPFVGKFLFLVIRKIKLPYSDIHHTGRLPFFIWPLVTCCETEIKVLMCVCIMHICKYAALEAVPLCATC